MELGDAILDEPRGLLLDRRGQAIPLRAQSMKVLLHLAGRPGEVVSREDLLDAAWGEVHVTDDSLTQCVSEIRQALGDEGHRVLQTVPKRGYRLVPEAPAAPVRAVPIVAFPAVGRIRPWVLATPLALVATLGLGAWAIRPAPGPAELPTIAVLPFANLAGEPRWERLGRGIAAEIDADLTRSRTIVAIPADTIEATAGSEPEAVAKALDVRFVLDGTLQADGDELRVTARLTDAEDNKVVWSDRWVRPATDLFAVQDEIVARIGSALDGTWTGALARAVREGAKGRPTESLDAYELYLLGLELKNRETVEGYAEAEPLLRRALAIDPDFVPAMVMLGLDLMVQSDRAPDEVKRAALIEEGMALVDRAVQLEPDSPLAVGTLATLTAVNGRFDETWSLASRSVELAPTNADVLAFAAMAYPYADHGPAPLEWAKRAVELNPGHPAWYNLPLSKAALMAGDLDLALQAGRAAPTGIAETLFTIGVAEALSGHVEEGGRWFQRFADETHYRSLGAYFVVDDMSTVPAFATWVKGARLVGFPVTEVEADRSASR
ncbi:adenylate/guanylate cyclase [Rubellimicrobium mesophilum DSM 19309]|uniref:Adenylate/guanylate cyclase n=1 Tax=Rubellimicrobium mesophilum DSM 19309 TaxID=442562 RepID=A0A017HKF5_9RHOB|nr:winged helix-turn-helix domain-containing protein [Rubellimicrobium mesophilum]EYD74841.1 adenylate/guanylate cyclase [Rubellimicrobium mesophilum DSM 19309]